MDYNKLATFRKVCEAGGFTKAARMLFRSQSAISQQVQLLEQELGLTLILRKKGGIQLTPDGQVLFESLKSSYGQIDETVAQLTDTSNLIKGTFRVGVLADYGSGAVVKTIPRIRATFPNVELQLVFKSTSREIEAALERDELDFGVLIVLKNAESFKVQKLYQVEHILVAAPAYLKKKSIKTTADLLAADLIDFTSDFTAISYWVKAYAPNQLNDLRSKKAVAIAPNHEAIKDLVKAGLGVAVMQIDLVESLIKKGDLVRVLPQSKPLAVQLLHVYKKGRQLRPFESQITQLIIRGHS